MYVPLLQTILKLLKTSAHFSPPKPSEVGIYHCKETLNIVLQQN